jgi:glycosyltransferase involved in cell wall biosynthesis
VKTFETFARYQDVDYYFFSAGQEWYWLRQHGVFAGNFKHEYLRGFRLGRTRVTPTLLTKLYHRHYDVYITGISGRFAMPSTYLIARLKGRPFILWTGIWHTLQTPFHRLVFPLTRFIYRHADAIVVYGIHVRDYLLGLGVGANKIFVAPHAMDNEHYARAVPEAQLLPLRKKLGIGRQHKVMLYVGRLVHGKGLGYLIEAFASIERKNAVLVLVGEGEKQPFLERQVRELGLVDRVRFIGYVPPDEMMPYYALAWVCVLVSVTTPVFKEPWGLIVNEAMNQGVPVIATDAVGAAAGGLVQDGVNGLVVPERDSAALAAALCRILDNPAMHTQMSQNARTIVAGWDNERMVLGFRHAVEFVSSPSAESGKKIGRVS